MTAAAGAAVDAHALYREGRLDEAVEALGATLRHDPADLRARTFLFELLCFAGAYDRAGKQLDVIAASGRDAEMGAWLYRSALHAERLRQALFSAPLPAGGEPVPPVRGRLNGRPFRALEDADPRIGARLELFAAGQYTWMPLHLLASVRMEAPARLRDLLWTPARVQPGAGYAGDDLGEVLLPAVAPLSWRHPDPEVRLGRVADEEEGPEGVSVPVGAKLLRVDGEMVPLLDVRELEIDGVSEGA